MRYRNYTTGLFMFLFILMASALFGNRVEETEYENDTLNGDGLAVIYRDNTTNHLMFVDDDHTTPGKSLDDLFSAAPAAGSPTQVQFNDSDSFGGDAGMVYDKATDALTLLGQIVASTNIALGQFLFHNGDTDTYLWFITDILSLFAGSQSFVEADANSAQHALTINAGNNNIDFRVQDATGNTAFKVQASDGVVSTVGAITGGTDITAGDDLIATDDLNVGDDAIIDGLATIGETLGVAGNIESNGTAITLDSPGEADLEIDRAANSNRAVVDYQTAGVTEWMAGTLGDTSDDYQISTGTAADTAVFEIDRATLDTTLFGNVIEGRTPVFGVSGFGTGDALRTLEFVVGAGGNNTASFSGVGNYLFEGTILPTLIGIGDDDPPVSLSIKTANPRIRLEDTAGGGVTGQIQSTGGFINIGDTVNSNIIEIEGGALDAIAIDSNGAVTVLTTFTAGSVTSNTQISADGDMVFVGGGGLGYGGISFTTNTTENHPSMTIGVWEQEVAFFVVGINGPSNGSVVPNGGTDPGGQNHILVTADGDYQIAFAVSLEGTAGKNFEIQVFLNDGSVNVPSVHVERLIATGPTDVGSASGGPFVVSLSANDTVELWVRSTDSGAALTVRDCALSVLMVGGN